MRSVLQVPVSHGRANRRRSARVGEAGHSSRPGGEVTVPERRSPAELRAFASDVVEALGAPTDAAERVAASLVAADVRGYGTHGVGILPLYAEMVADGAIEPAAEPMVERGEGSTIRVDGRAAFGQLTAREATAAGVDLAEASGAAVVGFRDASHVGPLGEWARLVAGEEIIFLGFTNTGGGAKNTAPFGGHERKLSTNPVAFGFPTFGELPFDVVADFATSQVSGSVVRTHHRTGEPLDDEWTTTATDDPVGDPAAFMDGDGALLPLGGRVTGHKGYALSLAAELLGGLIGDSPVVGEADPDWLANGGAFVVVDPTRFVDPDRLRQRVRAVADHLRTDEVRLPGEGAHERRQRASEEGVELATGDLVPLMELAGDLGVSLPDWLRAAVSEADEVDNDVRSW